MIARNRRPALALLAACATGLPALPAPAAAQAAARVGGWSISPVGTGREGICSATRLYGDGYALEILQARSRPGQLILRLESPNIRYRPGQTGEEIEPGVNLQIVIGGISGQEGREAVVREGPRGLGFVTTLKDEGDPRFSPLRTLRSGRAVHAYIGLAAEEERQIGNYDLAGSSAALDALGRCAEGGAAASPQPARPAAAVTTQVAPAGPLGIAPGYYVDAAIPCGQALDIFFYDGRRVGIPGYDGNGDPSGLELSPLGRVSRTREGTLLIESLSIELRKLPGGRIELTIQDTGPAMRLCGRDEVPARFRAR